MASWFDQFSGTLTPNNPGGTDGRVPTGLTPPLSSAVPRAPTTPAAPTAPAAPKAPTAPTSTGPPTLNASDPASRAAFIKYYANQPGANPSLTNDPGYWDSKIASGELGSDPNYIISKFMTPEGAPAGGSLGSFGPPPAFTPYQAPAPFTYGDAPTFTAPDPASTKDDPGYQFRLDQGEQALQASKSAQGTLRTGGTLKDITNYASDYASSEYDKIFARSQSDFQNALATYGQNRANAYGNYTLNLQTGQYENSVNNAGSLAQWAAQYGMSQDEIHNLLQQEGIGATAAAGAPPPVPPTTATTGASPLPGTSSFTTTAPLGTGGGALSSLGAPLTTPTGYGNGLLGTPSYRQSDYASTPNKLSSLYA